MDGALVTMSRPGDCPGSQVKLEDEQKICKEEKSKVQDLTKARHTVGRCWRTLENQLFGKLRCQHGVAVMVLCRVLLTTSLVNPQVCWIRPWNVEIIPCYIYVALPAFAGPTWFSHVASWLRPVTISKLL